MTIKELTKEQLDQTILKCKGNASRPLEFLKAVLWDNEKDCRRHLFANLYFFDVYAIYTHAVEEFGKLLYLKSLEPNSRGLYEVDYSVNKFRGHNYKMDLAIQHLPEEAKIVRKANFDPQFFSSDFDTEDTIPNWDNRLNVWNVDLDENNNPTDIEFEIDPDKLIDAIFNLYDELSRV